MSDFTIAAPEPDNATRTISTSIAEKDNTAKLRTLNPRNTSSITRPRELPIVTGLCKTTCWRLEKAGDFPKRIQLSAGAVGYRTVEIETWLESRQSAV
jgi:prophage regulatory protein